MTRQRNRVAAAVATILFGAAQASWAQALPTFDLPDQPLAASLKAIGSLTNTNVLVAPELVDGRAAPQLKGQMTLDAALTHLLSGTPLRHKFINDGTVVVTAEKPAAIQQKTDTQSPNSSSGRLRLARMAASEERSSLVAGALEGTKRETGDSMSLEEVIVTAQKRSERLQDVPVPVSVLDAQVLANTHQLRIQDYYTKVPGLGLSLIGNGEAGATLSIRGLTMGGATNPTVGVVIDEVSYGSTVTIGSDLTMADIDPSDLARVEVLRGPQGTLYGASSIGGLLKFTTTDPSTEEFSGSLQTGTSYVAHGSDLGYDLRGSVNVPVSDTFAVRASGFSRLDPGYIDNVQTGERDVNERESRGARIAALWRPSEDLSVRLSALAQEAERAGSADSHLLPGLGDFEQDALRGTGGYERTTQAYGATIRARLGAADLISATGYSVDETSNIQDVTSTFFSGLADTFFGVDGAANFFERTVEKVSQEIRLTVPVGARAEWMFGGFYTREKSDVAADFTAIDPVSGAREGRIVKSHTPNNRFQEYAAFTNLTVHFSDRLDVQFGARYSENEQEFSSITSGELTNGRVPEIQADDDAFTYLVTPRFKISPDLMVYARLASGYRPGAPNVNCGLVPCAYGADTTSTYEIGVKGNALGRSLSFDASVYYIDWEDVQLEVTLPSGQGYITNGSRAKSTGVEVAVESRPLSGLTLSGWVAWNDAVLSEEFPATATSIGRSGDRLPYGSPLSGGISADQAFPIGKTAEAFVGASVSYVDDRKGIFPSIFLATPQRQSFASYTQLDIRGGVSYETWEVNVFVNNATDERALIGGDLGFFIPFAYNYIQPRTVGVSVTKTF